MVRVTTIKINLFYLKMFFMIAVFAVCLLVLKTTFFSNSSTIINNLNTQLLQKALQNAIALKDLNQDSSEENNITTVINEIYEYMIGFNIKKPETVLNFQIPVIASYGQKLQMAEQIETPKETLDIDEDHKLVLPEQVKEQPAEKSEPEITPIETVTKTKGVTLINETNYNIDLNALLSTPLKINQNGAPQVLIYHTHTCESYTPSLNYSYAPSDTDRTTDLRYTVARVGDELANTLKKQFGINVIHDKTIHDGDSYNRAYTKSLNTVQGYIKKYPSLSLIIDLHRDAAIDSNGRKLKVLTKVDGKPVASMMAVIGTDGRGLPHPNWRENLKLGAKLIKKTNDLYPGMGRGVDVKLGRFNQYLSKNSILLEVGSNGNTLDETIASTKYIARTIAEVLKEAR